MFKILFLHLISNFSTTPEICAMQCTCNCLWARAFSPHGVDTSSARISAETCIM